MMQVGETVHVTGVSVSLDMPVRNAIAKRFIMLVKLFECQDASSAQE